MGDYKEVFTYENFKKMHEQSKERQYMYDQRDKIREIDSINKK